MADVVVQRALMPAEPGLGRLYFRAGRRGGVRPCGRRSAVVRRGASLRTDTYFNGFFEGHWRKYTALGRLDLRVCVSGAGVLRLYRRHADGRRALLRVVRFAGRGRELGVEVPPGDAGLLFFEARALSRLVLHRAEWVARGAVARPAPLAVCYCTCDREAMLLRNVAALLEGPAVAAVIVVDQGGRKVREHPDWPAVAARAGGRLRLVEQDNRGGAGGFTRGLLEAETMGAAHVLLMDDDATAAPEAVCRAAAFLGLARGDVAVGGQMLDLRRPCELAETAGRYRPDHVRVTEPLRRRMDRTSGLNALIRPEEGHYNGWWFFAFPLRLLDRVGLPLPLFLRGDDVELGCRLLRAGVPTVSLPGVAVWHEPFECKGHGWQPYYELRNLLIVGALHFPARGGAAVARRFLSRLLDELLAYDYGEAWLLCEAVAAYLRGPDELRRPPGPAHARLRAAHAALAPEAMPCGVTLPAVRPAPPPAGPWSRRARRLGQVVRNLVRPGPPADALPAGVLRPADEQWYVIAGHDVVAVAGPGGRPLVLRRARGRFVRLLLRGVWLALRLLGGQRRSVRRWCQGAPALTGRPFWGAYLGRAQEITKAVQGAIGDAAAPAAAVSCGEERYAGDQGPLL
jgi:galactofuranosylgalactofuranosylrhamnosyl-N-acetylglucosaminyl-diphospho-decaprenol beta-1,5/1,6-galactofuranosyltransferase